MKRKFITFGFKKSRRKRTDFLSEFIIKKEIKVYLSNPSSVEKNKVITCEETLINLSSIDTIIPYSYDLIDEITSHNNFPILYHLIYLKITLKTPKTKEIT